VFVLWEGNLSSIVYRAKESFLFVAASREVLARLEAGVTV
jgi:hypothetical protein